MYPDNGGNPLRLEKFVRLTGVADLIYNPARTNLLLEADQLGVRYVNGLSMLVAQAEMASRVFINCPERPGLVGEICDILLKKTRNIALIGMPGCGKSTVGRMLAQALGRPLADTDKLIEAAAGDDRSIPEIITEDGEGQFRRLETRVLSEAAKQSGTVIATGGGVVTRTENLILLRQNSLIVYLKRELSELITDGRPLSQNTGIQTLAKQRLPLYEAWSDCVIQVESEPERTALRIQEAIR